MKAINSLLLASLIGIELFLGIIVAKIIFYPPLGLNNTIILDSFNSGVIMGKIFLYFAYILLIISIFNLIYEFINLRQNYNKILKISKLILAIFNFIIAILFLYHYTIPILEQQELVLQGLKAKEILKSVEFDTLHTQSELSIKVLVLTQLVLYFLNYKNPKA